MTGQGFRRLSPGTVTFQMRLHEPLWLYDDEGFDRLVDVEVEIRALLRLSSMRSRRFDAAPTFAENRHLLELAAQRIINCEGPSFVQPVRVSTIDLRAFSQGS